MRAKFGSFVAVLMAFASNARAADAPFLEDINLVDMSVYYFLERLPSEPVLALLDRNGDAVFDILDVDLAIHGFLHPEAPESCATPGEACADGGVCTTLSDGDFCIECQIDDECNNADGEPDGSYCHSFRCVRSCGRFEADQSGGDDGEVTVTTERRCYGRNQACDVPRGRCYEVANPATTCHIDADCLPGNYCLVGTCAPACYRQTDCLSSAWACAAESNQCVPKESLGSPPVTGPEDIQVAFGRMHTILQRDQAWIDVPVVLIDKSIKRELVSEPSLFIPYRLQMTYGLRRSDDCDAPPDETPEERGEREARCATPPFLVLERPFGILEGKRGQTARLQVVDHVFTHLQAGTYNVELRLIAGNGNTTRTTISYENPATSGHYTGLIAFEEPVTLGQAFFGMDINITEGEENEVVWSELLANNYTEYGTINLVTGLPVSEDIAGQLVYGEITANESLLYPSSSGNIPFVGLYQPESNRLRIMFDLEVDGEPDSGAGSEQLTYQNAFARPVRRLVYMLGELDTRSRNFIGVYRETLMGIASEPFTVGGPFSAIQGSSKTGTISTPSSLVVGHGQYSWNRPTGSWSEFCTDLEPETIDALDAIITGGQAADPAALLTYLRNLEGAAGEENYFGTMLSFSDRMQDAVDSLPGEFSLEAFFEHIRTSAGICTGEPDEPVTCINAGRMKCALHFYGQALHSGLLGPMELTGLDEPGGAEKRWLRYKLAQRFLTLLSETMMVHNHEAGDLISKAYALFLQDYVQDALTKELRYTVSAFARHQEAQAVLFHPRIVAALRALSTTHVGVDLDQDGTIDDGEIASELGANGLQAIIKDPVAQLKNAYTVLSRYLNLRVRASGHLDATEHAALRGFTEQAYLQSLTLLALQQHWLGSDASFVDQSYVDAILRVGSDLELKVRENKNPFGLNPGEVFFESHGGIPANCSAYHQTGESNYAYYLAQFNCWLDRARQSRTDAQYAFSQETIQRNQFEADILQNIQRFEAELADLCGSEEDYLNHECPTLDDTSILDYQCASEDCEMVVENFTTELDPTCRPEVDPAEYQVKVGTGYRYCYQGNVGSLLRRADELKAEQTATKTRLQTLMRQIDISREAIVAMVKENDDLNDYYNTTTATLVVHALSMAAAENIENQGKAAAECFPKTTGMSNDATSAARGAAMTEGYAAAYAIKQLIAEGETVLRRQDELEARKHSQDQQVAQAEEQLHKLILEGYNLAAQYNVLERQVLTLKYQVQQSLYRARVAADQLSEQNERIIDYLIGDQVNHRLQRNYAVTLAERAYEEALVAAYKLGKAFEYEYNYPSSGEVANRVFEYRTIEELVDFLDFLAEEQTNRWEGLGNPTEVSGRVLRISIADLLFPEIVDVVDRDTSRVVTKGEQFHQRMFSSQFRKLRPKTHESGMVEQIEIPINLWLQEIEDAQDPTRSYYLIDPEACNALVEAIRIIFYGSNIDEQLTLALRRGGLDDSRTCYKVPDPELPLAPPKTIVHRLDLPTHQYTNLNPCVNSIDDGCLQPLFRDRSLGSSDWTLIIPHNQVTANQQFFQYDGALGELDAALLRDIELEIVYRYRTVVDDVW